MWIEKWNEFFYQAQELYVKSPSKVRFTVKYRSVDAKLVLKVTDDRVCLKYRTDQASDVKKVEKLSNWFFKQTTNKRPRMDMDSDGTASAEESSASKAQASPPRNVRASKRRK